MDMLYLQTSSITSSGNDEQLWRLTKYSSETVIGMFYIVVRVNDEKKQRTWIYQFLSLYGLLKEGVGFPSGIHSELRIYTEKKLSQRVEYPPFNKARFD